MCIITIQRLYSMLKGEEEFPEENEEASPFKTEPSLLKQPLPVGVATSALIIAQETLWPLRLLAALGRYLLLYGRN